MRFLPSAADDRRLSQDNGPVEMTAARVDRDVVSVPCVGGVSRLIWEQLEELNLNLRSARGCGTIEDLSRLKKAASFKHNQSLEALESKSAYIRELRALNAALLFRFNH